MKKEDVAEFYSRRVEEFDRKYGDLERFEKLKELFEDFVKEVENGRILDAGCGTGRDTEEFVDSGFEAVGVDISGEMIKYCRENREGDYRQMDMRELEFEDSSFEGVWCCSTIFFMPEEEMAEALEEFHRVLKAGGLLHIVFKEGNGSRVKQRAGEEVKEYLLEKERIVDLMEEKGFEPDYRGRNPHPEEGPDFINFFARPKDA